jgi:hypothetical protein
MAETLDQAVQLMNSAKLCSDAREKVGDAVMCMAK